MSLYVNLILFYFVYVVYTLKTVMKDESMLWESMQMSLPLSYSAIHIALSNSDILTSVTGMFFCVSPIYIHTYQLPSAYLHR